MSAIEILGSAMLLSGVALSVLAAWGLLDFPSALARMHATTKSASLGLASIALGAAFAGGSLALIGVGILVAGFMFMTAPISGHMLGRAVYAAGQVKNLVHDDLANRPPQSLSFAPERHNQFSLRRLVPLVVVWVFLWRDASVGVWIGGIGIALIIELIRGTGSRQTPVRFGAMAVFLAHYAWMVVLSNVRVAWEVITPRNDQIREAIVAVPLRTSSVPAALLVANAISYTPGSLTIELAADPLVLYVHVLHFESPEEVQEQVARLEDLVLAALGEPLAV